MHTGLNLDAQSQIRVGEESQKDVFSAAMRIVTSILDIEDDLTPTLS